MLILKKADKQGKTPPQSRGKTKTIYQGQNSGHRKFPVYFIFFFLTTQKQREDYLGGGGGELGKAPLWLTNLVN